MDLWSWYCIINSLPSAVLCQGWFCSFAVLVHAFLPVLLVFIDFYLKVENTFVDIGKIAPAFGKMWATQHNDKTAIWDAFVNADKMKMLPGIHTVQGDGEGRRGPPQVFRDQFIPLNCLHLKVRRLFWIVCTCSLNHGERWEKTKFPLEMCILNTSFGSEWGGAGRIIPWNWLSLSSDYKGSLGNLI